MPKPGAMFERLLLATDGSPSSQDAAEVAAVIAKSFDSEVTVLSAIPSISASSAPMEGEYYSSLVDKADDAADKAAAVFRKAGVQVEEREVPKGTSSVVATILQVAEKLDAGLIVTGTRGRGGFKRAVLGSVSGGVAEHASCSTLVVRAGKKSPSKVLVAVDGSPSSQRALEAAAVLAKGLDVGLVVVHVVYIPSLTWSMGVSGSAVPTQRIEDDAAKAGEELLERAVRTAKGLGAAAKAELVTDLISPAEGIVQLAERDGADIIVVGTRGNEGFKKLLLGSVANSVLHYARCSVLVTK